MELGSVTLKRIGFFCFPIKHSTHTREAANLLTALCTPPGDGSPSPAPPPSLTIPADVHPSLRVDTPARARTIRTRTLYDTSYKYSHTKSHPTDVASYKARRPGLRHRAAQHGKSPSRQLHHPGPACAVRDRQQAETTSSRGLSAPQHTHTRESGIRRQGTVRSFCQTFPLGFGS
jgi:hypothetical protein